MTDKNSHKSEKVCTCQQIMQNIAKELDDFYNNAHDSDYSEDAQQYQLLVGSYSRVGYDIKRNSKDKHVVTLK